MTITFKATIIYKEPDKDDGLLPTFDLIKEEINNGCCQLKFIGKPWDNEPVLTIKKAYWQKQRKNLQKESSKRKEAKRLLGELACFIYRSDAHYDRRNYENDLDIIEKLLYGTQKDTIKRQGKG